MRMISTQTANRYQYEKLHGKLIRDLTEKQKKNTIVFIIRENGNYSVHK